jgi:acetoin utilization deacetylase AcuC-like enzyme
MKVFYRAEQNARNAESFSPSAGKPREAVQDWLQRKLIAPEDVLNFEPATRDQLKLAHDPEYVDAVLNRREPNGFGNTSAEVAASLPYTTGSLLAAAHHALATQSAVCSPTSGFHHARYANGAGFCTFNGLMVTALALKQAGLVNTVGIIDLDMHYGDGTDAIIQRCDAHWIRHHTQGAKFHTRADVGPDAQRYVDWLDAAIADCQGVDLLIYQAGADPHIRDPLGGLLNEVEMAKRDHAVFRGFKRRALVWNLAGGYQRDPDNSLAPVLRLHRHTVVACQTVNAK